MSLKDDLVIANRILYAQGVVDAFGHVSVRDETDPGTYWIARNMAPASVTADDLIRYDYDGAPSDGDERRPYLERYIHGSVFRARSDVGAVVHSHAQSTIPFGIVPEARLRPVWHMSSFIGGDVPIFEIRDVEGDASDLLVRSSATGDALAHSLGQSTAVLMRGHGATVVGRNVHEAVFRAVYLALNARVQVEASRLGALMSLTAAEAIAATATIAGQIDRAWDLWAAEAAATSSS